jgi:hypothetical protein
MMEDLAEWPSWRESGNQSLTVYPVVLGREESDSEYSQLFREFCHKGGSEMRPSLEGSGDQGEVFSLWYRREELCYVCVLMGVIQ